MVPLVPFFIKAIAVGVSFLLSFAVFVGIVPETSQAPTEPIPALVTESTKDSSEDAPPVNASAEDRAEKMPEEKENEPASSPAAPAPSPQMAPYTPSTPANGYGQSLKDALDALQRLEAENVALKETTDVNAITRAAVVNILCTTTGAGSLNPISASGVVIDQRGIVLTNAHVGQYFLLKNYPSPDSINCTIRTGSPAYPAYKVSLLFLPPSWVAKNAQKIDDDRPTGNGEHDWALLRITETVSGDAPPLLPSLPLVAGSPSSGDAVLLAGYPAGFLGGATILRDLYAVSANAAIGNVYTYQANTIDLFSLGGTVVAQQGSSGGAVATLNTSSVSRVALTGLIVTSSDAPDTGSRDLRALSTEYIIRDFASERGISLSDYLARDLEAEQRLFEQNTAPTLSAALVSVLEQ